MWADIRPKDPKKEPVLTEEPGSPRARQQQGQRQKDDRKRRDFACSRRWISRRLGRLKDLGDEAVE